MAKNKVLDYGEILRSGYSAASEDVKLFNKWYKGDCTLRECFEQLMKHSTIGYVDEDYWDPDKFRFWLGSLGYSNLRGE